MTRASVIRNTKPNAELLDTERRLLRFVAWRISTCGYQPSMREIAAELGYASPGYVPALVESLKRKGIVKAQHGARAIEFAWREWA